MAFKFLLFIFVSFIFYQDGYAQCVSNTSYFQLRVVEAQGAPFSDFIIQMRYNSTGLPDYGSDTTAASSICTSVLPTGNVFNGGMVFSIAWNSLGANSFMPTNGINPSTSLLINNNTGIEFLFNPFSFTKGFSTPQLLGDKYYQDYGDGAAAVNNLDTWVDGQWYNIWRISSSGLLSPGSFPEIVSATDPWLSSTANGCPYLAELDATLGLICDVGFAAINKKPNIKGKVFNDLNQNCVFDSSDYRLNSRIVQLFQNSSLISFTTSDLYGNYRFYNVPLGTYEVKVDTSYSGVNYSCSSFISIPSILTITDTLDENVDFGLTCTGIQNFDCRSVQIIQKSGIFFPGVTCFIQPVVTSFSCIPNTTTTVKLQLTGAAKFINAQNYAGIVPTVYDDSIIWQNVLIDSLVKFPVVGVKTDTNAIVGNQICFLLSVHNTSSDLYPLNDTFSRCFNIVNSYDPNDKQVLPQGTVLPTNNELVYTIRFQNTGTAPAYTIKIRDTISSHLDLSTLKILASSHNQVTTVDMSSRAVVFAYDKIQLPDSTTNEPASHGFVTYTIKQNSNLPLGTLIENNASIYFDYNTPVLTNTTSTLVDMPTTLSSLSSKLSQLKIFPQPASQQITLQSNSIPFDAYQIFSMDGKILEYEKFAATHSKVIPIRQLQKGMYLIEVKSKGNKIVKKIIVE